jgi:hypothetical protein
VSVYHYAAYRCNRRARENNHDRAQIERCRNSAISTHILEATIFEMIRETMLDPGKLRGCVESGAGLGDRTTARELASVARKIGALDQERRLAQIAKSPTGSCRGFREKRIRAATGGACRRPEVGLSCAILGQFSALRLGGRHAFARLARRCCRFTTHIAERELPKLCCDAQSTGGWANCRREQMQQKPRRCLFRVLAKLL